MNIDDFNKARSLLETQEVLIEAVRNMDSLGRWIKASPESHIHAWNGKGEEVEGTLQQRAAKAAEAVIREEIEQSLAAFRAL